MSGFVDMDGLGLAADGFRWLALLFGGGSWSKVGGGIGTVVMGASWAKAEDFLFGIAKAKVEGEVGRCRDEIRDEIVIAVRSLDAFATRRRMLPPNIQQIYFSVVRSGGGRAGKSMDRDQSRQSQSVQIEISQFRVLDVINSNPLESSSL